MSKENQTNHKKIENTVCCCVSGYVYFVELTQRTQQSLPLGQPVDRPKHCLNCCRWKPLLGLRWLRFEPLAKPQLRTHARARGNNKIKPSPCGRLLPLKDTQTAVANAPGILCKLAQDSSKGGSTPWHLRVKFRRNRPNTCQLPWKPHQVPPAT